MNGYLIKVTYLTGPHAGESYLLRKGGYVTEEGNHEWDDTTYRTLGIAQAQCKRLAEENERCYNDETWMRERRLREGKELLHEWRIYEKQSYEPHLVENVGKMNIN